VALIIADQRIRQMEAVRSLLSTISYPVVWLASAPARLTDWLTDSLQSRDELQVRSDTLHRENLVLRARLQRYEALEAENMRLRDLLDSSFKIGDRVLIAELVSMDLDPLRQQVMINKGSSSGVFVGQPVLDANSVVGQVVRVTRGTATVLLITDAGHSLPVQVNRNGLRTLAEGTGLSNELRLPYLPNNADIKVDDLLVTSGLGDHFPPGYPVARVTQVRREPGKHFASIQAAPIAHPERTREMLLVWSLSPDLLNDGGQGQDAEDGAP
jgi:rod shape-determining protein MreC